MTRGEIEALIRATIDQFVNVPAGTPGIRSLGTGPLQAAQGSAVVPIATALATTAPIQGGGVLASGLTISMPAGGVATNGYLSSANYATFNAKVGPTRAIATTAPMTGGGDLSTDRTIAIPKATGAVDGYLAAADFAAFAAAEVPIGAVCAWLTASPPTGWLILDGSTFSAVTYPALNTLLGGNTLPDMRGRFPLGKAAAGTGNTLLGTGGAIDHTHSADPPSATSGAPSATTDVTAVGADPVASSVHTHDTDVASFTTGTANPPFLAVNWIVRAG